MRIVALNFKYDKGRILTYNVELTIAEALKWEVATVGGLCKQMLKDPLLVVFSFDERLAKTPIDCDCGRTWLR